MNSDQNEILRLTSALARLRDRVGEQSGLLEDLRAKLRDRPAFNLTEQGQIVAELQDTIARLEKTNGDLRKKYEPTEQRFEMDRMRRRISDQCVDLRVARDLLSQLANLKHGPRFECDHPAAAIAFEAAQFLKEERTKPEPPIDLADRIEEWRGRLTLSGSHTDMLIEAEAELRKMSEQLAERPVADLVDPTEAGYARGVLRVVTVEEHEQLRRELVVMTEELDKTTGYNDILSDAEDSAIAEIVEWQNASGLTKDGIPDNVTPDMLREYIGLLDEISREVAALPEHRAEKAAVKALISKARRLEALREATASPVPE